jgi:WD40 repeat protein
MENAINDATLYDLKSGREIKSLSTGQRHHDITFSAEGDLAIGAGLRLRSEFSGFSGTVFLWNLSQKLQPDEYESILVPADFVVETFPQRSEVMSVALAGKFGLLATERAIWRRNDVGTFTASAYFPLPEGAKQDISKVAFTAGGKELEVVRRAPLKGVASSNLPIADCAIEFWSTGEQPDAVHTFLKGNDSNIGFLADNRTVILGQINPVTFDSANGMRISSASPPVENDSDKSRKILGSAGRLAVVTDKKQVYLFDGSQTHNTSIPLAEEFPDIDEVKAAISEDGKFLALAGHEAGSELVKVTVYELIGDGYRLHRRQTLRDSAKLGIYNAKLALTPDGVRLITYADDIVHIWNLQSGEDITPLPLRALSTPAAINEVNAIELSPAGTYLAVAYTRTALKKGSEGDVERDPEDEYMEAQLVKPNDVVVVRLSDGAAVNRIEHSAKITVMTFSGRENYLLTASAKGLTILVRPDGSQSAQTIRSDSEVSSATFSADERYLALGAKEGTTVLLAGEPQSEISFLPDTGAVTEIVFSPDGKLLATLSHRESTPFQNSDEDDPLRVWHLAPNDLLADAKRRLAAVPDDLRQPPG